MGLYAIKTAHSLRLSKRNSPGDLVLKILDMSPQALLSDAGQLERSVAKRTALAHFEPLRLFDK